MAEPKTYRGSRKHVLDWTNRPEFPSELLDVIGAIDCEVTRLSKWMPRGFDSPREARLEHFGPIVLPSTVWNDLRRWWLVHEEGANTPNWDIAAGCQIDDK